MTSNTSQTRIKRLNKTKKAGIKRKKKNKAKGTTKSYNSLFK